jgi:hypothetical protein
MNTFQTDLADYGLRVWKKEKMREGARVVQGGGGSMLCRLFKAVAHGPFICKRNYRIRLRSKGAKQARKLNEFKLEEKSKERDEIRDQGKKE